MISEAEDLPHATAQHQPVGAGFSRGDAGIARSYRRTGAVPMSALSLHAPIDRHCDDWGGAGGGLAPSSCSRRLARASCGRLAKAI
jgi:hypothetical protein